MRSTLVLGAAFSLVLQSGCADMAARQFQSRMHGKPAPDFELSALGGGQVKLSDSRGKPVLLAFFGYG